ncbi:MAG: SRPBCC family protein, partial [Streptosporangiaceae bacterium]|nr:SRPBCC family protein [Streptosporangiaceae bacterium]
MKHQTIRFERERAYPMPVSEAWRLLADTDHLNRAIGLPAVEFSALPDPLVRRARARVFGVVPVRWREFPFDWIRERRYAVLREFDSGPIARMVVGIELQPMAPGVTVRSYAECTPANVLAKAFGGVIKASVADTLDFCDRYLSRKQAGQPDPAPVPRGRPAVDRGELDRRLGQLAACPVRAELVSLLRERIL